MKRITNYFQSLFHGKSHEFQQEIIDKFPALKDEIFVLAYIAYADQTVHQDASQYIHDHYNRHYAPEIIKKIVKYLHLITKKGNAFLWQRLEKIREKYKDDRNTLLFFMLESHAVIKLQSPPSPKALEYVDNLARLFEITPEDQAMLCQLFKIKKTPENQLDKSNIKLLKITGDISNADVFYPDEPIYFSIIQAHLNYYIINNSDLHDIFVGPFPVPAFTVERIPVDTAVSFGQHQIHYSHLDLLFKNKLLSFTATSFFNAFEDTLSVSEIETDKTIAAVYSKGNLNRLVLKNELASLKVNGHPVQGAEVYIQITDTVKIDNFPKFKLINCGGEKIYQPTILPHGHGNFCTISTKVETSPSHIRLKAPSGALIHLKIQKENNFYLLDREDQNGPAVFVNEHIVKFPFTLKDGDIITTLNNYIIFDSHKSELTHYFPRFSSFAVTELIYKFHDGNMAVNKVSFKVNAGTMVAIMGPSGCGKSTLLNILNGSVNPSSGRVMVNGHNLHENYPAVRSQISYSPQDDLLFSNLSVSENLITSTQIRKPAQSRSAINKKCLKVLADIGLLRKKDEKVGDVIKKNLSGGQRKRVNIGVELMTDPDILFLDEPTSGLSSLDSEQIIRVLKQTALLGKIVFVVIHQPSSAIFKMFDQLILLDNGGKLVFFGDPKNAVAHFKDHKKMAGDIECTRCGNMNPEVIFDILEEKLLDKDGNPIEVEEQGKKIPVRKYWPAYWRNHYKHYSTHLQTVEDTLEKKELPEPAPFSVKERLRQTGSIFYRNFLNATRDIGNLVITLLAVPAALALFISFILITSSADTQGSSYAANANISTFLFLMVIVSLFLGLTCSADQIIKDRKILIREKMLDMSILSYYLSKICTLLIFALVQNILFLLVSGCILDNLTLFWVYLPFCYACSFVGITMGLLLSSFNITTTAAYNIIPLILIPQIILGGAILKYDQMNKRLLRTYSQSVIERNYKEDDSLNLIPEIVYFMPSYYAFEGVMVYSKNHNAYESYMNKFQKQMKYWNKLADDGDISEKEIIKKNAELESAQVAFRLKHLQNRYQNMDVYDAVSQGKIKFNKRLKMERDKKNPWFFGVFLSPEKIVFHRYIPTPYVNLMVLMIMGVFFAGMTLFRLEKKL